MNDPIPAAAIDRQYFLDNLRTSVIILVVIHHVAMVYGAFAPFYYTEQPFDKNLMTFCIINQSWFMGFLFLLSGYFTPESLKRKGPGCFIREKLIRLGIPALFFYLILNPVATLGIYQMPASVTGITGNPSISDYPYFIGLGPLWFVVMLLVFNILYVFLNRVFGKKNRPVIRPGIGSVLLFSIILAVLSFVWRILIPIGKAVWDFPTLAYLPQYCSFFAAGILLSPAKSLDRIAPKTGIAGFAIAAASLIILFPLAYSGKMFSMALTGNFLNSMGGGTWQSLAYSFWDALFAAGISAGLLFTFSRFFNRAGPVTAELSRCSYSVYILHCIVIVGVAVLFKNFNGNPFVKTSVVSLCAVPASFIAAFLIRRLPGIRRVL